MSAHFYLLQRYTAAILALVIFIRLVVALKYPRREIAYIFMVVAVLSAYFTWQGGISALALLGVLLGTWGTFQPNDKSVRLWLLPASGAWLIHNILIVSPAACVIELFSICSNVVGFRRYYGINDKLGGSNCPSTVASKNR